MSNISYQSNPERISFYRVNTGELLTVTSITFNGNQFGNIQCSESAVVDDTVTTNTFELLPSQYYIECHYLTIPNIPSPCIPGDIVSLCLDLYDSDTYQLNYGWHTNSSNQTIESWYLVKQPNGVFTTSLTNSTPRTVYQWMLDKINVVSFVNPRSVYITSTPEVTPTPEEVIE